MNGIQTKTVTSRGGRWVSDREYAELADLPRQTLANWRFRDRKAGRRQPDPSYPIYRYFGGAVRYWLSEEIVSPTIAMETAVGAR
jgi:hypothetical protein